jgi:3,4-dihydroxy 2-butanone 4-phosphate synthase
MNDLIDNACERLRAGGIVLVYDADGREEETDMVVASEFVNQDIVRTLRKEGGGLICVTIPPETRRVLGIPYMVEVLNNSRGQFPILDGLKPNDIPYDAKSSFSLTINHRKTFTGITDKDRALTISQFAKVVKLSLSCENGFAADTFSKNFRSPGHVHLLNASDRLILDRQGHTELATALVTLAGITPTATICEMMGDDGRALSKSKAKEYAASNGMPYLEGADVIRAFRERCGKN